MGRKRKDTPESLVRSMLGDMAAAAIVGWEADTCARVFQLHYDRAVALGLDEDPCPDTSKSATFDLDWYRDADVKFIVNGKRYRVDVAKLVNMLPRYGRYDYACEKGA